MNPKETTVSKAKAMDQRRVWVAKEATSRTEGGDSGKGSASASASGSASGSASASGSGVVSGVVSGVGSDSLSGSGSARRRGG